MDGWIPFVFIFLYNFLKLEYHVFPYFVVVLFYVSFSSQSCSYYCCCWHYSWNNRSGRNRCIRHTLTSHFSKFSKHIIYIHFTGLMQTLMLNSGQSASQPACPPGMTGMTRRRHRRHFRLLWSRYYYFTLPMCV